MEQRKKAKGRSVSKCDGIEERDDAGMMTVSIWAWLGHSTAPMKRKYGYTVLQFLDDSSFRILMTLPLAFLITLNLFCFLNDKQNYYHCIDLHTQIEIPAM